MRHRSSSRTVSATLLWIALAWAGGLAGACGADRSPAGGEASGGARAPGAPAAPPVVLPDLSQMTASVQQQIRERDAALRQLERAPDVQTTALADAYGEVGRLLLAAEDLHASAPYFDRAQTLAPNDFRWPYYLGYVKRTAGALAEAATHFERALTLNRGDVPTLLHVAEIALSRGAPDRAVQLFEQVRTLQPRSTAALFGLGRAALASGAHAEAAARFQEVLAIDPRATAVHYPLSLAYRELGDAKRADAHLQRRQDGTVSFADPLLQQLAGLLISPASYESRGISALDAGDWKSAVDLFTKGLELDPRHASLRHRLGTALFMAGDTTGAQREFERVVRESPAFSRAHFSLGVMMETGGRLAEAERYLAEAVRLEPAYVEARLRLASSQGRAGRLDAALAEYRRVLELDPRIAGARYAQAIVLARLRRYGDARDVLRAGLRAHPDQPSFALGLARVLSAAPEAGVRNGREARDLLDKLSDADRSSDAGETIAMVLAELGEFGGAQAWQQRAIEAARQSGRQEAVERLTDTLGRYQRGEPNRTPWGADELP